MDLFKKIPFFLLLLPLFFCLHGSVENYGNLELQEVLLTGVQIVAGIALLFLIVLLFAKRHIAKAALISFFISLWYLFFGVMVDTLATIPVISFLSRYSFLIPLLLLLSILWIIFLKRKAALTGRFMLYLNILLILYCGVDITLLVSKHFSSTKKTVQPLAFNFSKVTAKPNVYCLVFDEYAGYKSLKDSFNFGNDSLYAFLQQKQFGILPVTSNYDLTLFSMSSMFNMQYIDSGYNPAEIQHRDLQLRANEIKQATVFNIFDKLGYRFKNYSVFDIKNQHAIARKNALLPVNSVLLTDKILHNRVIRTATFMFKAGKLALPSWRKKYLLQHDTNNAASVLGCLNAAKEKRTTPQFCYAHFVLPHWPYYRDSAGAFNNNAEVYTKMSFQGNKALYLAYLKYTNTIIKTLVNDITNNDSNAVIIIASDHGYRHYGGKKAYEALYFDNFCAIRFSGNYNPATKQPTSLVNLFRYLFNNQFDQQMPYLKDSTMLLSNSLIHF